jgi:CRP-like cAMP-binding protein
MTSGSVFNRIDPQLFADILLRIVPDLPQPVVESLWSAHGARRYSPAEYLHCEGEASQGIFLIVSGLVRLSLSNDRVKAKEIQCRELRSPAILGVNDVMLGSPVSLTARALTELRTAFIPKTAFLNAVRQSPSAGIAFSHLISQELTSTYSRISELRANSDKHNGRQPGEATAD